MSTLIRNLVIFFGGTVEPLPPPSYTPSLDFSDARNSFYRAMGL